MNAQRLMFRVAVLLLPVLSGCQASVSSRLVGEWQGRPDTAAAAAERTAQMKARQQASAVSSASDEPATVATPGKTELEEHDLAVTLRFESDQTVEMTLAGGKQPLTGVWRVIESLPPNGAVIEISLAATDGTAGNGSERSTEKRRFVIDFQQNGETVGFTLMEKGADPQFGRLYFTRQ